MHITEYVLGFMFDPTSSKVALIRKNRPPHLAGQWNGVGGLIEPHETYVQAMVREFKEETGLDTSPRQWKYFGVRVVTEFQDFRHLERHLHMFVTEDSEIVNVHTATDEPVFVHPINFVCGSDATPALCWEVPMALKALKDSSFPFLTIKETNT